MSDIIEFVLKARDEASGPIDRVGESLHALHGHLSRIMDIAGGNLLGGLGLEAVNRAIGGIDTFASGLIDANVQAQNLHATLQAVYRSSTMANQAFNWIRQNEQTVPFDFTDIAVASTNVARFGGDITGVIPTLEKLGSIFRSTLGPEPLRMAAQAWQDMHAGLWRMMKRDLGVNQADLASTGLAKFDSKNKFVGGDLDAALAAFVSKRYPDAIAASMNTLTGALSSLKTQFTLFQQAAGQQVFGVLQGQISSLVSYLQNNKPIVQGFATLVGDALGGIARSVVSALPYVLSGVIFLRRAFGFISEAAEAVFNFVAPLVSRFANWLQTTGFPAIQKVLAAIGNAWISLYDPVKKVLQALTDDLGKFFGAITTQAGPIMQGLAGVFRIGLGVVLVIFGGALDLLSGNWAKFQNDISNGADLIAVGFVQAFGGLAAALVPLADKLFAPWTWLAVGVRKLWKTMIGDSADFLGWVVDGFEALPGKLLPALSSLWHMFWDLHVALFTMMEHAGVRMGSAIKNAVGNILGDLGSLISSLPGKLGGMLGFGGNDMLKNMLAASAGIRASAAVTAKGPGAQDASSNDPFARRSIEMGTGPQIPTVSDGKKFADLVRAYGNAIAPGIDPRQYIHAGRTVAQAQADILAKSKQLQDQMGIKPGEARGQTFDTKGGFGKELWGDFKKIFDGLGGKVSMTDLLAAFGLKNLGNGKMSWPGSNDGLPGSGGLKVPGMPGEDPTGSASGAGGAGLAGITQRVRLGQLGATFGQSLATTSLNGGQDRTASAAERMAMRMEKLVEVNVQIRDALVRGGMPAPQQTSAARSMGVARPGRL